jgi:hypothetical protein
MAADGTIKAISYSAANDAYDYNNGTEYGYQYGRPGNNQLPTNFGTGQNDPIPYGQRFGPFGGQDGRSMMATNNFSNGSGNRSINHQFGSNNPNIKRNIALMGAYQKNMQAQQSAAYPPVAYIPQNELPPQVQQIQEAIQTAYINGCFDKYSQQIYNILMVIVQYIPPNPLLYLQNAYNNPNMSLSGIMPRTTPTGALWASLSFNIQNEIIQALNYAYNRGCIPQNIYINLQNLLSALNNYNGPIQTPSTVITSDLTTDYNNCLANARNPSVCMNFKSHAQTQASAFNMENGGGY